MFYSNIFFVFKWLLFVLLMSVICTIYVLYENQLKIAFILFQWRHLCRKKIVFIRISQAAIRSITHHCRQNYSVQQKVKEIFCCKKSSKKLFSHIIQKSYHYTILLQKKNWNLKRWSFSRKFGLKGSFLCH